MSTFRRSPNQGRFPGAGAGRCSTGGSATASSKSTCTATTTPPSACRSSTARSRPTTRWASTTPGAAPTRTSSSATTRCSARRSATRTASTARGCGSRSRSRRSSGSRPSATSRPTASPSSSSAARSASARFAARQTEQSIRLGYWMDWDNSYYTMSDENNYTIWHFLKTCHERGWIYKGHDAMPWCPRCGTGISEHEIVTEGYQERTHLSRLRPASRCSTRPDASLLVWTTTPWTLAANVAAAVHPGADLRPASSRTARRLLRRQGRRPRPHSAASTRCSREVHGRELVGRTYRGPFDELPAGARRRAPRHRLGRRQRRPRAPASSTSPPAAARRTSRSRRSTASPSSRRSTRSASTSPASAG